MTDPAPLPVHVYFALDRSGSMQSLVENVVTGFNTFLKGQKELPGDCLLTMIQFDSEDLHDLLYDAVPIADAKPLTAADFTPRGGTPLRDAEGWLINRAKKREIERTAGGEVAEAILFATFTDGHENASHEWTQEALTQAKEQLEQAGWTFTYLGVGLNNYAHTQQSKGVGTRSAVNTQANAAGVASSYNALNLASSNVRSFAGKGLRIGNSTADLYAGLSDENLTLNVTDDEGVTTSVAGSTAAP